MAFRISRALQNYLLEGVMEEFKVGDKVKLTDYSWCRTINKEGKLVSTGLSIQSADEPFVVESLDCLVDPKRTYWSTDRPVPANNVMLRNTENGRVIFTHTRYLRHVPGKTFQDQLREYNTRVTEEIMKSSLAPISCLSNKETQEDRILKKMMKEIEAWGGEPHELAVLVKAYRKFKDTIKE